MKILVPDDLKDLSPMQPNSAFFMPFLGDGFTRGLWVRFNDRLPPVLGRVLAIHPSVSWVGVGDVVHYSPNAYDWVHLDDGRSFAVCDARGFDCVLEGYDTDAVTVYPGDE